MGLRHYDGDSRARFITFCTHKKMPLLTNSFTRGAVVYAIAAVRDWCRFKLLGYAIMPEHVHLVIVPREDDKIGRIIGDIKREAAVRIIDRLLTERSPLLTNLKVIRDGVEKHAFWQRRCYDHNCRTAESVREILEYCHNNPVRRGLVADPGQWRWSSYRWYHGLADVVLEMDSADGIY